ncbi:unnamed protein product [Agarophyton chilense]|eukprot:gb/GEZJ01001711.1/.p1 GENE.gb/GEZJ01001711.1/~~gb/GEZJ01001711.1/.p1  ORF type:complete len:200 (-),score=9.81 gb/GEZJ01001711.1/:316-915(-)
MSIAEWWPWWHAVAPYTPNLNLSEYAVFILIPLLGGVLSFVTSDNSPSSVAWRRSLRKSALTPGTPVIAFTWVLLYVCMGHASFVVYHLSDPPCVLSPCLVAYLTQCLLNHFFIIVLFGLQRIDLAFLMIVPLWLATALTTLLFYDVSLLAGRLMAPVLAWVSFNVYLNFFLYANNPVYTDYQMQPPHDDDKCLKLKHS